MLSIPALREWTNDPRADEWPPGSSVLLALVEAVEALRDIGDGGYGDASKIARRALARFDFGEGA